jgi:predicted signal transduction protein with EAL and GGDEF domain
MAQALSIEVVAEGVETQAQLDTVRDLGCELAQGFYFHRPLQASAITALLAAPTARPKHRVAGANVAPARPAQPRTSVVASGAARRRRRP